MNKVALIVGGSSGIGFELSKLLLQNQYIVYNASRRSSLLDGVINITYDVANNTPQDIIDAISEKQINLFVYSAGFSMASPIETVEVEDFKYLFETNYFGLIYLLKSVIPVMKKHRNGRIVAISSVASFLPIPYDTFYCASKEALNLLIRELNYELNRFSISASSILIPPTKTQFSYKRKIYESAGKTFDYVDYVDAYKSLEASEQDGYQVECVSKKVYKNITKKKMKGLYVVGMKYQFFYGLNHIMPQKFIDKIIKKHYNMK